MPKKVDLPSGAWVEIRTELLVRDRFIVQEAARATLDETGSSQVSYLAMQNDMRNALLGRIITAWSYQVPVPAQNSFAAADVIIGDHMDLDDYAALEREVEPLMEKISGKGAPDPKRQQDA